MGGGAGFLGCMRPAVFRLGEASSFTGGLLRSFASRPGVGGLFIPLTLFSYSRRFQPLGTFLGNVGSEDWKSCGLLFPASVGKVQVQETATEVITDVVRYCMLVVGVFGMGPWVTF